MLTALSRAYRLACSADAVHAATSDGKLFTIPLGTSTPTRLSPDPAGVVGWLAESNGSLFYTLPAEGEVHVRDLATGADTRLASGRASPQGIAVSSTDVFFSVLTGVERVARTGADQTPSVRITFPVASNVGPGGSLAFAGEHLLVGHSPTAPGRGGEISNYFLDGELLDVFRPMFSGVVGVASTGTASYWTAPENQALFSGPVALTGASLSQVGWMAKDQFQIAGLCAQGKRIYFTMFDLTADVNEIRYVDEP